MEHERERLEVILKNAADAILVFDPNGRLSLMNPAGERLFSDQPISVGMELKKSRGYDELIGLLENTQSSQTAVSAEIHWQGQRSFMVQVTPIEDGGHVAVLHDVTHFKNMEQMKNELIATLSHDLKNPINVISGFSSLMTKVGPLNDQQKEFVDCILAASQDMDGLVQNMLEITSG
jgi:two-component system, OmpR family, phosphate regulon sensor histidine kinase PhoR